MRTRRILKPTCPLPVPNRTFAAVLLNAGIQAVEPPKPRIVCSVAPKSTTAVLAAETLQGGGQEGDGVFGYGKPIPTPPSP